MRKRGDAGLVFRHHIGWFAFIAGILGFAVFGIPIFMGDSEYREAFFSGNPLASVKFVVLTMLDILVFVISLPVTVRMWRSAWIFEITPDRLIAIHQFTRRRHEIPWELIAGVGRLPPSLLVKSAPRQFSYIQLADGTQLLFNPYLSCYDQFVQELRRRAAACRFFDPYPAWLGPSTAHGGAHRRRCDGRALSLL